MYQRQPGTSTRAAFSRTTCMCQITLLLPPVRIIGLGPVLFRPAEAGQGAAFAKGRFREADEGAKIHETLVQVPGPIAHPVPKESGPPVPDLLIRHIVPVFKEPGHDPQHVPVHGGLGLTEGYGGDGPGGVGADTREPLQFFHAFGEPASVLPHHSLGALFQVPGPGIVAEALPQLEELLLVAGRQTKDRGELGHEPAVVGDHRRRPGLLEHDLRHQNGVGVPRPPPGKGALVFVIPFQQGIGEFHESSIPYSQGICYRLSIKMPDHLRRVYI